MLFKLNKIQCLHCKDILISTDDVQEDKCSCGKNVIHGGSRFLARTGKRGTDYTELSEVNVGGLDGSESTEEVQALKNWQRTQTKGK